VAPSAGDITRFRDGIGAAGVRLFYNVVPEFASALGVRSVGQRAKSAVVSSLADVILVSGAMAGEQPPLQSLAEVKQAIPDTPVFLNTGAKAENVTEFLRVADGVIVGSSLKMDGYTWNPVDPGRVKVFMDRVRQARQG
jgi:membrane complex biogenesis BtpA family protein